MDALVRFVSRLFALMGLVAVGATGAAVYSAGRTQVVEGIYRDKLAEVVKSHEDLRQRYDTAVNQTIVTELEVKDGRIAVLVRNVEGIVERIDTDLDPKDEIHVDYLVIDGRLYIRRVYDDATPAKNAKMIDPKLARVDWSNKKIQRGLTVYRGALSEGRWLISTTGNGALDLVKAAGPTPPLVAGPVPVQDFDEVSEQINEQVATVKTVEVIDRLQKKYLGAKEEE